MKCHFKAHLVFHRRGRCPFVGQGLCFVGGLEGGRRQGRALGFSSVALFVVPAGLVLGLGVVDG